MLTLAVVFVGLNRIVPAARSFYAAKRAPSVASIVPIDLKDKSVSQATGTKLSYFGYEFEVPWNDLDNTQTKLYPNDTLDKRKVQLRFHSGLRLLVSSAPPREWAKVLRLAFAVSPQVAESAFGYETLKSDYRFVKALYEFTPENMNHWIASQHALARDQLILMVKSSALPKSAETGIFTIQNEHSKGFQQGNPRVRQDEIVVDLYSDDGDVEMIFFQADYQNFAGVTQSEINRIVQSLHRAPETESTTPQIVQK